MTYLDGSLGDCLPECRENLSALIEENEKLNTRPFTITVQRLERQLEAKDAEIESMKCCGNCKVYDRNEHLEKSAPCSECKRLSVYKTSNLPIEDKWVKS